MIDDQTATRMIQTGNVNQPPDFFTDEMMQRLVNVIGAKRRDELSKDQVEMFFTTVWLAWNVLEDSKDLLNTANEIAREVLKEDEKNH